MKKLKLILTSIATLTLSASLLAGCGTSQSKNSDDKAASASGKVLSDKKLTIAINATFPPFESVKVNSNGDKDYEGLDLDVIKYMSEDMGFTYEINDMKFSGLIGSLQSKRADVVISGISPTGERKENADFTDSYFFPKTAILSKKGSNITKETLKGKKVSTTFGTSYEKLAKSFDGVEVTSLDSSPAAVKELTSGRVDGAILDAQQCDSIIKEDSTLEKHIISDVQVPVEESFAIACQKDSELTKLFNDEIKKMKDNGKLNEIIKKWVGEEYTIK